MVGLDARVGRRGQIPELPGGFLPRTAGNLQLERRSDNVFARKCLVPSVATGAHFARMFLDRRALGLRPAKRRSALGLLVPLLGMGIGAGLPLLSSGCAGRYDVNEVLRYLVERRGLDTGENTVTVRLSNQTAGYDERVTLRIDGLTSVFECPADEMVCDYILVEIPDLIEVIEEQRYDEDGGFAGGRILEGQPGFTLDKTQYRPGSIIVLQMGVESARVRVL